jgi:hypothetical protein
LYYKSEVQPSVGIKDENWIVFKIFD